MSLTESDVTRAAKAVVAQQGKGALVSVSRYVALLRDARRRDLADDWQRIADRIATLAPCSFH